MDLFDTTKYHCLRITYELIFCREENNCCLSFQSSSWKLKSIFDFLTSIPFCLTTSCRYRNADCENRIKVWPIWSRVSVTVCSCIQQMCIHTPKVVDNLSNIGALVSVPPIQNVCACVCMCLCVCNCMETFPFMDYVVRMCAFWPSVVSLFILISRSEYHWFWYQLTSISPLFQLWFLFEPECYNRLIVSDHHRGSYRLHYQVTK